MSNRIVYTLHLTNVNDRHGREPHVRLRIGLKHLLRSCSLRCVRIEHNDPSLHNTIAAEKSATTQTAGASGKE